MSKLDTIKVFATQTAAVEAKPADAGKKKVYTVCLPTPEDYAKAYAAHGNNLSLWSDGYAQSVYQVTTKLMGFKVTVASDKADVLAVVKAKDDQIAAQAAKMAELEAAIAAIRAQQAQPANPAPVVTPPAHETTGNNRNRRSTQPA